MPKISLPPYQEHSVFSVKFFALLPAFSVSQNLQCQEHRILNPDFKIKMKNNKKEVKWQKNI